MNNPYKVLSPEDIELLKKAARIAQSDKPFTPEQSKQMAQICRYLAEKYTKAVWDDLFAEAAQAIKESNEE